MYVVDINTSFGRRIEFDHDLSLKELLRSLDSHQVAAAVTHSLRGVHYDPAGGSTETLAAAREHGHLIPAATLDLRACLGWEAEVERCLEAGVHAFQFLPESQGWSLSSVLFQRILDRLRGTGVCLMFPVGAWQSAGLAGEIARVTADANLPVILSDIGYGPMAETLAAMREYSHVYAETNLLATMGAIEVMADEVGPNRLLYGSGATMRPMQKALNEVLEADLPDDDKAAILGGNAMRLLRVSPADLGSRPQLSDLTPRGFQEEIVDVHSHLGYWRYPIVNENYDSTQMLGRMKRYGISHSVLSSYEAMRYDMEEGNRALANAIEGRPELLGYVELNPHQLERSCAEMDRYYQQPNFAGAELELTHTAHPTGSREVRALMHEVAKRGKPILLMPAGPGDAPIERELALENPDLTIIHAHSMDVHWARAIADAPNIYVEFCLSSPCHHDIRDVLEILGPERLLFGSDQTLLSVGAAIGLYLDAELSPHERRLVLHENAKRVFGL